MTGQLALCSGTQYVKVTSLVMQARAHFDAAQCWVVNFGKTNPESVWSVCSPFEVLLVQFRKPLEQQGETDRSTVLQVAAWIVSHQVLLGGLT